MRVTYIGTPDDATEIVEVFGITFAKGVPVQVADDHPKMEKFANNRTFTVTADKPTPAPALPVMRAKHRRA